MCARGELNPRTFQTCAHRGGFPHRNLDKAIGQLHARSVKSWLSHIPFIGVKWSTPMKSRVRRVGITLGICPALIGTLGITPANAAVTPEPVYLSCGIGVAATPLFTTPVISVNTITWSDESDQLSVWNQSPHAINYSGALTGSIEAGPGRRFSLGPLGTSTAPLTFTYQGCGNPSFTVTMNFTGGLPSSTASLHGPTPIIQQYGKQASGSCDAIAPESLNWSGVASGGWSESWALWMNGGTGGGVCTRMLVYDLSQAKWVLG